MTRKEQTLEHVRELRLWAYWERHANPERSRKLEREAEERERFESQEPLELFEQESPTRKETP